MRVAAEMSTRSRKLCQKHRFFCFGPKRTVLRALQGYVEQHRGTRYYRLSVFSGIMS